jgi:hypothetical protein
VTLASGTGPAITCTGEEGTGEYTGMKTVGAVTLTFTGCERAGSQCSSGTTAGVVVSSPLAGTLGVDKRGSTSAKDKIGLDLSPVGGAGTILTFSCGASSVSVDGSVIAPVKSNKMSLTSTLKYRASKGKQKPEGFEGAPRDVLEVAINSAPAEPAGLTLTMTVTDVEALEVNAYV